MKEKYLGKYFLHKEFDDKWFTYIYVNNLDEYNNLHSFTFTFCYNEKKDDIILVKCETLYDFSCHYVSKYDENPRINECVEITKDIFLKEYQVFINHIQKYLDNN